MSEVLSRAIYDTAHDFEGGVPALAKRLATNPGTLFNKVNPSMEGHRLNLEEALAIMLLTDDRRILYALAQELHHACVPLGDYSRCGDMELLDLSLTLGVRRGEVDKEIRDALEDGRITHDEKMKIRGRMQGNIRAQMELFSRIDALAEAPTGSVAPKLAVAGGCDG